MKEQIEEMRKDLIEIFDEEYEKRRMITPDFTAEKMTAKRYRKQEWISVEDRLPDKGQEVLCYRGDFNGDMMNTYTYLGSKNWEDDYGYRGNTEHEGITHWMPLPEPPKMKGGAE